MKKTLTILAMAGVLAFAAIASSSDANAQRRHRGGAIGLGIVGGIAAGAIIGGAIANRPAYGYGAYAPVGGYVPYDGYYVRGPVACPGGYWARRPIVNPYGQVVGYSRPRYFCPPY